MASGCDEREALLGGDYYSPCDASYSSIDGSRPRRRTRFVRHAAVGCAALALVGTSVAVSRRGPSSSSDETVLSATYVTLAQPDEEPAAISAGLAAGFSYDRDTTETGTDAVQWFVTNKYTDVIAKPIGLQYSWASSDVQIIDPYYDARLNVGSANDVSDWDFEWTLSCSDGRTRSYEGKEHVVTFDSLQDCDVAVTGYPGGKGSLGKEAVSSSGVIKVRYVRRELRELIKEDRELWLDSLAEMWWVSGEEGRELYGDDFISSNEMLAIHATNSALRDNDHFHNGAGFLAQHLRLDAMVMKSVQAIDPSISTPYWDWTIESRMLETGVIESPFETPLWTSDWFGSLNYADEAVTAGAHYGISLEAFLEKGMEAWAIRDGRWKFATVMRMPTEEERGATKYPLNSYGYLRSPWNNNPSPFVTRINFAYNATAPASGGAAFKTWPSCTDLYNFIHPRGMNDVNVSSVEFMTHLEDMTVHANVHQALGGTVLDLKTTEAMIDGIASDQAVGGACYQTVAERHIWRAYLADMTQGCDPDLALTADDVRNCQLDCSSLPYERLEAIGAFATEQYACTSEKNEGLGDASLYPTAVKHQIGELMCGLTFIKGEHLEASGTTDPSFFIVHPTLARYYQLKKLMATNVLVDDWASVDGKVEACIPAIGECYIGTDRVASAEDCCAGHFRYSTYFLDIQRTHAVDALTNGELIDLLDPENDGLDAVVFHHMDWRHCEEEFAALPYTQPDKKLYWPDFYSSLPGVEQVNLDAVLHEVEDFLAYDPSNQTVELERTTTKHVLPNATLPVR